MTQTINNVGSQNFDLEGGDPKQLEGGGKQKQQFKCTAGVNLKDFTQEMLPQTFIQAAPNVSAGFANGEYIFLHSHSSCFKEFSQCLVSCRFCVFIHTLPLESGV